MKIKRGDTYQIKLYLEPGKILLLYLQTIAAKV